MTENESEPVAIRGAQEEGCSCDEMKRRTRAAYRAYRNGDIDAILRNWSANARFYLSDGNILRWGGLHSGTAEIRDAFTKMNRDLRVVFFIPLIMCCLGSVLVSFGTYRFECRQGGSRFFGLFLHILRFNAACEFVDVTSLFNARRVRRKCPATARVF